MSRLIDYFSLIVTLSIFAIVIYAAVIIVNKISSAAQSTKASLKEKGYDVTGDGVQIKKKIRIADREEYIDATQRGFVKVLGASTVGGRSTVGSQSQPGAPSSNNSKVVFSPSTGASSGRRHSPSGSTSSEEKKKGWFGRSKAH
ncbi:hypothetical protein ABKN59_009185 [Abortiporus biennis]